MVTWAKTYCVEIVAILVAIALLVLAWTPPARGGEPPFTVTVAAPPAFTVSVAPAPPAAPARELLGWWVPFTDGTVRFVPVPPKAMPAPGVPARPFPAASPEITPARSVDTVHHLAPVTTWSGGSTPTAPTPTGVRSVVTSGLIDGCTSYG